MPCTPSTPVQQIKLTWKEPSDPVPTEFYVVYSVTGDQLLRDFNGSGPPLVMATGVVSDSVSFTLCDKILRLNIDVQADRGTTDSLDLITYMRKLP